MYSNFFCDVRFVILGVLLCRAGLGFNRANQLLVHELLDAQAGKFFAISRPLDSAKWQVWSADKGTIDKDHAGLDAAPDSLAVLDIGCLDRTAQAKGRVIGYCSRLLLISRWEKESHRSKELLLEGGIIGRDVGEDRRLHKRALLAAAIASREYSRAMSNSFADLLEQEIQRGLRRQ
jgi:hypothetical protein